MCSFEYGKPKTQGKKFFGGETN
jgi:hypothetical protein